MTFKLFTSNWNTFKLFDVRFITLILISFFVDFLNCSVKYTFMNDDG